MITSAVASRVQQITPAQEPVTLLSRQANDQFVSIPYSARRKPKDTALLSGAGMTVGTVVDFTLYQTQGQTVVPRPLDRLVDAQNNLYEIGDGVHSHLFELIHEVAAKFMSGPSRQR